MWPEVKRLTVKDYIRQRVDGSWPWVPPAPSADEDMPSFAKAALDEAVAAKGMRFDQTAIINEALKNIVVSNWDREPTATEKGNAATYDKGAIERARMAYERERHLIYKTGGDQTTTQSKDEANQLAYLRLKQEMAAIEVSQEERARIGRYNDWAAGHQRLPQRAVPEGWWEGRNGQWHAPDVDDDEDFDDDEYADEPEKEPENMAENFSTLIFLYDKRVKAIKAAYLTDDDPQVVKAGLKKAPETMFKTYEDFQVGDLIVVPSDTRHRMTVVKVTALNVQDEIEFDSSVQVPWVVSKVDVDGYNQNRSRDENARTAIRRAEKIKREDELKERLTKAGIGGAMATAYQLTSDVPEMPTVDANKDAPSGA